MAINFDREIIYGMDFEWVQSRTLNRPASNIDVEPNTITRQPRRLSTNWTTDEEHIRFYYDDIYDRVVSDLSEEINNYFQEIASNQPIDENLLSFLPTFTRKKKKMDMRLPDKLFEME